MLVTAACLAWPGTGHAQDAAADDDWAAGPSDTRVTVVREPAEEIGTEPRRGPFLRLGIAVPMPVNGAVSAIGNTGVALRVAAGLHLVGPLALFAELSAGRIPRGSDDPLGYGFTSAALGVRGTFGLFEGVLHAFAEAGGGVLLASAEATQAPSLSDTTPQAALFVAAGLQLDLLEHLSGEGGLRADLWPTGASWPSGAGGTDATTVLLSPYLAATWTF